MRITIILLAIIFILSSCSSLKKQDNSDLRNPDIIKITEKNYKLLKDQDNYVKGDAVYSVYKNFYDQEGNRVKDINYGLEGNKLFTYVYKYDSLGNKTSEILCDKNDSLVRDIRFIYKNNLLIEDQSYSSKGEKGKTYKYEYNTNNQLVKKVIYRANKNRSDFHTYTYAPSGKLNEKRRYTSDSTEITRYQYTYNKQGDCSGETINGLDREMKAFPEKIMRYSYVYDKKGNWTEKRSFKNEKPSLLIERTIEYR